MTAEHQPQKSISSADINRLAQATETTDLDWSEFKKILGDQFDYPQHLIGDFLSASSFLKGHFGKPKIGKYQWSWFVGNYVVDLVWNKGEQVHNARIRVTQTNPQAGRGKSKSDQQPRLF